MPDIQTEMQKLLQAWNQPEPSEVQKLLESLEQPTTPELPEEKPVTKSVFPITTNVSRVTFEMIRDNPGDRAINYVRRLETMGHKKSSTQSLIGQMLRQGMVWRDSTGGVHPNQKEFTPLKSAKAMRKLEDSAPPKVTKPAKAKAKPAKKYKVKEVAVSAGIAALVTEHKEKDRVMEIMNTLSLPDAKRLYNSLATYFATT